MKINRRTLLKTTAASGLGPLAGCTADEETTSIPSTTNNKPLTDVSSLLENATQLMLDTYPESASSSGIDHGNNAHLKAQLSDRSLQGQSDIASNVKAMITQMETVDASALSKEQSLDLSVVKSVFDMSSRGFDFGYGDVALLNSNWSYRNSPYTVAQNTGAFVEIPSFLDSSHSVKTQSDVEDYLARMHSYTDQLTGETERIINEASKGVVLPDFLLDKTIGQLESSAQISPESWGLVKAIIDKSNKIDPNFGSSIEKEALRIAEENVRPAIEKQAQTLQSLRSKATSDAGVWALPNGDEYYQWALEAGTTTQMSAAEVHQMGLDELAMLHGKMDPILKSIGYTQGSVGDRMTALGKDPKYHFSSGDKGRAEIMAFIDDTIDEIRALMPQAFNTLVPGFLEVTRIAPEVEAGAPGAYGGAGSIDGTKPGHFWINLRTPALHNKFSLADLTYHEAIPGHVWQGEYTFKQSLIRSLLFFNAYSEGWALYAQQIADELGVYEEFPVGQLGYLQSLAFRACRLVVDTGLHAKRWTREQANQWFVVNNGSNPEEVAGEVDRYCAWPGQACGYKVGHSAILNLRQTAKDNLGSGFDYKAFNDAVVLSGAVPMTVLDSVIDDYINKTKASL